jgi:DNA-binding response OmpR family regulator
MVLLAPIMLKRGFIALTMRILLVEDDPDQASLFASVLTLVGHVVDTVADAEAALTHLAQATVALAVIDWDLPGMKGDALVHRIKADYPGVKTLLYSNHSSVDDAARACGADAWLRKSEGIRRLREVVATLLAS